MALVNRECLYGLSFAEMVTSTALTMSYCNDLKVAIEALLDEYSNNRHQIKDASQEVHHLAYQMAASQLITKHTCGQSLPFQPMDILQWGVKLLNKGVERFNQLVIEGSWEEEEDLSNATTISIAVLDDIITIDDDADY